MKLDQVVELKSSFLSCEKDTEIIIKKLFIDSREHAKTLKKLLVCNTKDCLDNPEYDKVVANMDISFLVNNSYIRLSPKLSLGEHEEAKSYIIISYDNFVPSGNTEFRDNTISFDIMCNSDCWDLGDFRIRPLKIAGYIDGLLNKTKLTGIGTLNFIGCNELILDEKLSGYTLTYLATHDGEDLIPPQED